MRYSGTYVASGAIRFRCHPILRCNPIPMPSDFAHARSDSIPVRFQMLADDVPVFNFPVRFDIDQGQLPISSDSDAIRFMYFW